jgi:Fur family transcriptional regulator, ferric uptake regulator
MTETPSLPVTAAPDLSAALAILRTHGLRCTAARRVVLGALYAADGPLSAEQIAMGVGGRVPTSDVASVYRNLETLAQIGIVRHVHLGHSPSLYAVASAGEQEYLTCERCGEYTSVAPGELNETRETIRTRFGLLASFAHFPIVGLCAQCVVESRPAAGQRP